MKALFTIIFFLTLLYSDDRIERTQILMGTYVKIEVSSSDKKVISRGFKLIKDIEMSLSSYNPKAKVYQLNKNKMVQSDNYLTEVLHDSIKYYHETGGYFDVTIGSVTKKLYHFGEKEHLPSKEELNNAYLNIDAIVFNENNITLDKNITIDLGGIGKGYAVDKVAEYFAERNITKGKIALSGDIRCLDECNFSIQSPFDENRTLLTLKSKIPNLSISTSGTYRRYIKEKNFHHLINPKTKKQGRAFVSVTLLTFANNSKIDALATAIGVMPRDKGLELLAKQPQIAYVLVESNGTILQQNLQNFTYK